MKISKRHIELIEEFLVDPRYTISEHGRAYNKRGDELGRKDKEGYIEIYYKGVRLKLHRIVFRLFHGELQDGKVIHHKDSNTSNNHPKNLEQCDHKKNIEYKYRRLERTKK